ncbi:MAG TPA: asparagine synthase (glutamine-hydrolyzing) [Syntrophomonas sp.]|jgi:asparagine synthase (glutamine-hydrolysing)|nr:asparagine synthase (glutamine-hydrolyzing) [Syntrophomonas sp.]
MSGINLIITEKPINKIGIVQMNKAIAHRGPDGEGYQELYNGKIWLGHRRLATIDLSDAGKQPMSFMSGRYWLTFDGRIYNYQELREELEAYGYKFNSNTDAEVIMAAYDKWGEKCLNKFNGMWAFVIIDLHNDSIFISRDRFGIKPLYYYIDKDKFLCASEIKALLSYPDVHTEPDIDACKDYLLEGPKEYLRKTLFKNIYRFEPASFVNLDIKTLGKESINPIKYWSINPNLSSEEYSDKEMLNYKEQYLKLLDDSIELRLQADVKIGSALSGGLDSSSVVYLVNEAILKQGSKNKEQDRQHTFSSVYKSKGLEYCDESKYIDHLASFLNLISHQIEPREEDIIREHRKMIYFYENPPAGSCMSGWHTFKCVSQTDVKVLLEGQGADEQLAGYLSYLCNYITDVSSTRLVKSSLQALKIPASRKYALAGVVLNQVKKFRFLQNLLFKWKPSLIRFIKPLNQTSVDDIQNNLVNLLHYSDAASMAYSIESRMPFMDYRLVEFLARVPAAYKIHNGWTKYLARQSFANKLSQDIVWRRDKMGWPSPEDKWFRGNLKEWFCTTIEGSAFLQSIGEGQDISKRIGSRESITTLIRLLNLSVWYDVFFS